MFAKFTNLIRRLFQRSCDQQQSAPMSGQEPAPYYWDGFATKTGPADMDWDV